MPVLKPYDLRERSFLFGCEIVAFCSRVADRGVILRRLAVQLVDSGTSIGANLAEAVNGQSKKDMISKHFIALKEARETHFWLRLISASDPSFKATADPLIAEASEFVAMLSASVRKAQSNPDRGNSTGSSC
jgi:four helix bundle protein